MKLGEAWPDSGVSYWNHNVHYHPVILNAVPPGCRDAIDVGCGDGMLACALAARCAAVTGIDRDALMITLARDRAHTVANATFLEGDFMAHPFGDESVDFACANTSVHHMGSADAIAKMARVVRPGGRLVVVGLAGDGSPADWAIGAVGLPANWYYKAVRGEGSAGAPVLPPDLTWGQLRRTARRLLPGVRYRRHLLWRYSLIWDKPATWDKPAR
ncbi:MAG TPA: class I SAM-dependent methyltransferase [Trebonia sp.]|jgi:SAM-dependent methyltransferase|nr:class I SAM-dependent methyltransferase [Trebonia sp.]